MLPSVWLAEAAAMLSGTYVNLKRNAETHVSPYDKFYYVPREATEIANRMEESSGYTPDSIHYIDGGEL